MAIKPAFDYASRDFSNIQRDLLRRAQQVAPLWTDRDPSDFGMLLVDLWAYMGDIIHYYIDRASKEAFIQTATQRESVMAFANLYDYTPNFRTSSEATVYIANTGSASASLPANTKFRIFSDDRYYSFHSAVDTVLNPESTAEIIVLEGKRTEEEILTSSATGFPNQRYLLAASNVVPTTVRVFVYEAGVKEEWLEYPAVADIPTGVPGFVLNMNPESQVEIVFGDRASGRIPPSGTLITISYTTSSGAAGNLPDNSVILFENSPSGYLVIQGISASTGGSDGESVSSIRAALQSIIRTNDRAVTLQDYRDLTLTVSGVYNAVVTYDPYYELVVGSGYGVPAILVTPLPLITNYLSVTAYSVAVPDQMHEDIYNLLSEKGTVGFEIVVRESVPLVATNISVDIVIASNYVTNWVKRDVSTAIDSLFEFSNVEFGQVLTLGEVYKTILNIDGVDSADVTVLEYDDNGYIFDNSTVADDMPVNGLIRKGTITINTAGGINSST